MGTICFIKHEEIDNSLLCMTRQYLVGDLKRPQILTHFNSKALEIGITSYEEYTCEPSHRHSAATEYQYMLSGRTQYMDTDTGKVYEFITGDFYVIFPNTSYAQKSKPGTKILFIKVPSINDKQLVEANDSVLAWMNEGLKTVRTDYYYSDTAPKPNSIRPAAAVAIVDEGKLLLLRRKDNKKWTMPGGTLEFGESLSDCAVREVKEESGLSVEITDIIGTYTDPNIRVAYSDGEVRQEFTIVYAGKFVSDNVILDEESSAFCWVPFAEIDKYDLADSQRRRIIDAIEYYQSGKKQLG